MYDVYNEERRTKFYAPVSGGNYRVSVSKYNLTVRKIIVDWGLKNYSYLYDRLLISPIRDTGEHKQCGEHVQYLDGMLYCPKCEVIVELC